MWNRDSPVSVVSLHVILLVNGSKDKRLFIGERRLSAARIIGSPSATGPCLNILILQFLDGLKCIIYSFRTGFIHIYLERGLPARECRV
jgi:hypothetical protein